VDIIALSKIRRLERKLISNLLLMSVAISPSDNMASLIDKILAIETGGGTPEKLLNPVLGTMQPPGTTVSTAVAAI